ncbi:hypothetical protein EHO61_13680 [Leptospira fluminis]|uniref:Glycosyltransferase RgtA/B/C/D-like domain-containing protein n=1 Tax=Leptospira fluminis TaxID=2484979 RepID=A0A4R9GPB9_9LEPT|nr:hypothetical protein [Leptospira fluminis]TGK17433.1 hypothetical protein EHO61_13680 [Leptospira fluminis]
MNRVLRSSRLLTLLVLAAVLLGSVSYLKPRYSFNWDIHNKAVQAYSLVQNGFQSEELYYPGKAVDPAFKFFPQQGNVFLQIDQRNLSAFPVAFAVISAPWIWIFGFESLPYASAFGLFLCLVAYARYWRPTPFILTVSVLCTFLWILSVEYSEHSVFILFCLLSLSLAVKKPGSDLGFLLSGLMCGLTVWFRHEGLVYCASLALWIFLSRIGSRKEANLKRTIRRSTLFILGAGLVVATFSIFNFIDYGHPLGPRYMINREGLGVPFLVRLGWAKSLLFFGEFKLGYFGYMPTTLLLFPVLLYSWKKLSRTNKLILGSSLTYILLVLVIVPNDGFTNWGPRFFGPVVFPFVILFSKYFYFLKRRRKAAVFRYVLLAGLSFSFLMGLAGIRYIGEGRKQQEKSDAFYRSSSADVWIFPDDSIAYMAGVDFFSKIVLRVATPSDLEDLLPKLRERWPESRVAFFQTDIDKIDPRMKTVLASNPALAESVRRTIWREEELDPILGRFFRNLREIKSDRLKGQIGTWK